MSELLDAIISHNKPTALRLRGDPPRRIRYQKTGVDQVEDSWLAPTADALVEGGGHPTFTGCIVNEVTLLGPFDGVYEYDIVSFGDARGTKPTKLLNRGKRRTLDAGWDERVLRYLSWQADWKDCTATAADDVVTCAAHGFLNGQLVIFARLTDDAGITPQSSTSLGVSLEVTDRTTNTFKLKVPGGSAVNITTNMSVGQVIAGEFALGSPHPSHPYLYLVDVQLEDDNTDWKTASCTYRGLEEDKPYKRIITCNGQSMSSSEPIFWGFPDGGLDLQRRAVNLPQIVVTDHYLTIAALATSSVPLSQSEGGMPPNAPSIRTIVITCSIDQITYQWPAYWSRMAVAHADTLNSQLLPSLQVITSEYRWPVLLN